jgi:hypothetical protein
MHSATLTACACTMRHGGIVVLCVPAIIHQQKFRSVSVNFGRNTCTPLYSVQVQRSVSKLKSWESGNASNSFGRLTGSNLTTNKNFCSVYYSDLLC